MSIDYDAIVRRAISYARVAINDRRKKEVEEILNWWEHDETEMLLAIGPKPGEDSASWNRRPKFFPNIMRDVIWRAARIYDTRPRRVITSDSNIPDSAREMLERIWSAETTLALDQQLDRMTLLLGRLPLRIAWIEDEQRVDWQPFYPDSVDVVQRPDRPTEAAAVVIETTLPDSLDASTIRYSTVYTVDEILTFEDGKPVPWNDQGDTRNPYGLIPIVWYLNEMPWRGFWSRGWGRELLGQSEAIAEVACDLRWLVEMQSFGVPVFKGCRPSGGRVEIGPSSPIVVEAPPGGGPYDFRFETPNAQFEGVIGSLRTLLDLVYAEHHLTSHALRQSTLPSGIALAIAQEGLLRFWRARQALFTEFERQRAYISLVVWAVHNGQPVPARQDLVLTIDWPEPSLPIDPNADVNQLRFDLENDLVTRAQIIQRRNPELTEAEAMQLASEIRLTNAFDSELQIGGGDSGADTASGATSDSSDVAGE